MMKSIQKLVFIYATAFMSLIAFAQSSDPGIGCFNALESNPELQILKSKVALVSTQAQTLEMLSSDKRPNQAERVALSKWNDLRQVCVKKSREWYQANQSLNVMTIFDKFQGEFKENLAELYSGKITYGQFARNRQTSADIAKGEFAKVIEQNQKEKTQQQQRQKELNQANSSAMLGLIGIATTPKTAPALAQPSPPPPQQPLPTSINCMPNGFGGMRCQ